MITKEQEEALKNLIDYVSDYCQKNDISVLMVSSIAKDSAEGIEQICGSVVKGKGKHIVCAIAGCIQAQEQLGMFLTEGLLYASKANGTITNIPVMNADLN